MNKTGFTLIEVLLVIVLIATITAFSVPVFSSLVASTELNESVDKVVHSLRRAQLLSEAQSEDSIWGVFIDTNKAVIFAGSTYATRNTNFDEEYSFNEQINVSGVTEVSFSKLDGEPSVTGLTTLENSFGSHEITINNEGVITY